MVILVALFLAAAPASPPPQRVAAERQAVALVRIVPGAQVRFSALENIAPESFTNTRIRAPDGSSQPARLVEFQ